MLETAPTVKKCDDDKVLGFTNRVGCDEYLQRGDFDTANPLSAVVASESRHWLAIEMPHRR
jgi:hypothetical protein